MSSSGLFSQTGQSSARATGDIKRMFSEAEKVSINGAIVCSFSVAVLLGSSVTVCHNSIRVITPMRMVNGIHNCLLFLLPCNLYQSVIKSSVLPGCCPDAHDVCPLMKNTQTHKPDRIAKNLLEI